VVAGHGHTGTGATVPDPSVHPAAAPLSHDVPRVAEMSESNDSGPPPRISYDLEGALLLLGVLEDARDALTDADHLAVVVGIEDQVRQLSRKLGFDDPEGDADVR